MKYFTNHLSALTSLLGDADAMVGDAAWVVREKMLEETDPAVRARVVLDHEPYAGAVYGFLNGAGQEVEPDVLAPLVLRFARRVLDGERKMRREQTISTHGRFSIKDSTVLEAAFRLLGDCGHAEAEPLLLDLLSHGDPKIQASALEALGGVGSPKAVPRLVALLGGPLGDAAAVALGKMGEIPVEALARPATQIHALRAVEVSGDRRFFDRVIGLTDSSNPVVRERAAVALRAIADPEDAPRLLDMAQTSCSRTRRALTNAMYLYPAAALRERIGGYLSEDEFARHAAVAIRIHGFKGHGPAPLERAREIDFWSGVECVRAAGVSGPRECVPDLLALARFPGNAFGARAVAACEALAELGASESSSELLELLEDYPVSYRSAALPHVVKLVGKNAVAFLRKQLEEGPPGIRSAAERALASMEGKPQVDPQAEGLHLPPPQAEGAIVALNLARDPDLLRRQVSFGLPSGTITRGKGAARLSVAVGRSIVFSERIHEAAKRRYPRWGNDGRVWTSLRDLCRDPYPRYAWYVGEDGRIVIDTFDAVRDLWVKRLARSGR